jgi:mRNA-degrading endonuclease RelE of RelBE toxin-antitoxin system
MTWQLRIAKQAKKALEKLPQKDQGYLTTTLEEMRNNPFSGDLIRLKNQAATFRRRVGNYRIFFDAYPEARALHVVAIKRRTSTTY